MRVVARFQASGRPASSWGSGRPSVRRKGLRNAICGQPVGYRLIIERPRSHRFPIPDSRFPIPIVLAMGSLRKPARRHWALGTIRSFIAADQPMVTSASRSREYPASPPFPRSGA